MLHLVGSKQALYGIFFDQPASLKLPFQYDLEESDAPFTHIKQQLESYFAGKTTSFMVPCDLSYLPPFTKRVLLFLSQIPFGQTLSYQNIAAQLGNPKASRAVGNACGANPIPIIIPCHRVITTNRRLGGYSGGLHRKIFLLKHENSDPSAN